MSKPAEDENCENSKGTAHDARGDEEIREKARGKSDDDLVEWQAYADKRDSSLRPCQSLERAPVVIRGGGIESALEQKYVNRMRGAEKGELPTSGPWPRVLELHLLYSTGQNSVYSLSLFQGTIQRRYPAIGVSLL
jgi:hypothetical protein